MISREELTRAIYAELKRQGEDEERGWVGEGDDLTGEVHLDGDFNLYELAGAILDVINGEIG